VLALTKETFFNIILGLKSNVAMIYVSKFIGEVSLVVIVNVFGLKELDVNYFSELTEILQDLFFGDGVS